MIGQLNFMMAEYDLHVIYTYASTALISLMQPPLLLSIVLFRIYFYASLLFRIIGFQHDITAKL